jgi:hypothetical protein
VCDRSAGQVGGIGGRCGGHRLIAQRGAESALGNLDFSAALDNFGGANFAGAGAINGDNNLAVMIGTDSNANAGNIFASPGNNNLAIVLGNNSNANAFDGNRNLAAALGNDLSASAVAASMTDIVTFWAPCDRGTVRGGVLMVDRRRCSAPLTVAWFELMSCSTRVD